MSSIRSLSDFLRRQWASSTSRASYSILDADEEDQEYKSFSASQEHGGKRGQRFVVLSRYFPLFSPRTLCFLVLGFFLGLLSLGGFRPTFPRAGDYISHQIQPQPTRFRLLIPANSIDANVCKVLLGTAIMGYPAPTLINYNLTINHEDGVKLHNVVKAVGLTNHLKTLPASADDDFVLMIDGYDVWFQLRPSVLLERFHDSARRANDRLLQQFGPWLAAAENITQRVLFSAQKNCSPLHAPSAGCHVVPHSILPEGTYGPNTDVRMFGLPAEENPDARFRDRFLNSGTIAGLAKDFLPVVERAMEYSTDPAHDHGGSDQGIVADIWAEQEIWRSRIAARLLGKNEKDVPFYSSLPAKEGVKYELGIGVDYESLLGLPTNNHDGETEYIRYNDPASIANVSVSKGMPFPRVGPLPVEIARSKAPFDSFSGPVTDNSWADVPLFTNVRTGYTPVIIHHNEWRYGAKERISTTWNLVWWQPFAQAMWEKVKSGSGRWAARVQGQRRETATLPTGEVYAWDTFVGKIQTDLGIELEFEEICGPYFDVLFKDQNVLA